MSAPGAGGGPYEERRLHPRLVLPVPARFRVDGSEEWWDGRLENLSAGGAALAVAQPLEEGSVLPELHFDLPGMARTIVVAAAVLRCRAEQVGRHLAGLHFLNLVGEDFERVRLFVYQRLRSGGSSPGAV